MPTHQIHNQKDTIYFITFTCHEWRSLFEVTRCYYAFDKWFEYLQSKSVSLVGYVIMPNHFHGLLYVPQECDKTVNQLVSNGKRFLSYEIVKLLEGLGEFEILKRLIEAVSPGERAKGKKHEVFRPSFDAKECYNVMMVETKLDYIHFNPVRGKWSLVEDYAEYPYSSAAFYEMGITHKYVKHYLDTLDTEFAHQSPFQETLMGMLPSSPSESLSSPSESLSSPSESLEEDSEATKIEHINK